MSYFTHGLFFTFLDVFVNVSQSGPVDALCLLNDGRHLLSSAAQQLKKQQQEQNKQLFSCAAAELQQVSLAFKTSLTEDEVSR